MIPDIDPYNQTALENITLSLGLRPKFNWKIFYNNETKNEYGWKSFFNYPGSFSFNFNYFKTSNKAFQY